MLVRGVQICKWQSFLKADYGRSEQCLSMSDIHAGAQADYAVAGPTAQGGAEMAQVVSAATAMPVRTRQGVQFTSRRERPG